MAVMRALHVLTLLFASAVLLSQQADAVKSLSAAQQNELELQQAQADPSTAFEEWAQKHGRTYLDQPQEREQRFRNWMANLEHVVEHSQKPSTMRSKEQDIERYRYRHDAALLNSVDWRKAGIVGPIKNQHAGGAPCGCCWTFATTGITECINAMYTGEVVSVSEQQLIDCDTAKPYEDAGCEGGDFTGGLHYIITHGGIDTEEDYPYLAKDNKCNTKKEGRRVVTLDAWETVPPGNESALMQALVRHPVAVGMCVGPYIKSWRAYKGGIFDGGSCETPIDHAMVVVGYGTEDGHDYWLVKNSWNESFGEEGFIKFPRDTSKLGFGYASIAHEPAYPIKTSPSPKPAADGSVPLAPFRRAAQLTAAATSQQ